MIEEAKARMQKAWEHLRGELAKIRTGRATPALVENLKVNVYGGSQSLAIKELGAISVPEPAQLTISPWDKTVISEISAGISAANIGLTPVVEGGLVRIKIPPLTEERRKDLTRQLHQKLELYRVEIRQIRHNVIEELRKKKDGGEISEDETERLEKQLQEIVTEFIEEIDLLGDQKEREIQTV